MKREVTNKGFDSNGRLEWLDVLKCIVMYLVVVGHAVPKGTNDTLGYYIYSFHMPLFFMISGMTFYLQCAKREFTLNKLIKNKAKTLLWPYLVFSLAALPLWLFNFRIISKDSSMRIFELMLGMVYSNEEQVSSTSNAMWFLPTLFLALILFWLILQWAQNDEKIYTLTVLIIACFGYGVSITKKDFNSPWHIYTVPIALVFILAGYLFVKHYKNVEKYLGGPIKQLLFIIIGGVGAMLCAYNNVKISMAINEYGSFWLFCGSVIGFSLLCIIISKWIPAFKLFKLIGRNTVVILAFHSPMFRTLEKWSDTTAQLMTEHPVLMATGVFVCLIPICWIVEKFLPFLLGRPYGKFSKKTEK